jgi:hypothetical protein
MIEYFAVAAAILPKPCVSNIAVEAQLERNGMRFAGFIQATERIGLAHRGPV